MKKLLIITLACISLFILNGCTTNIPDDATVAVCPQGNTFKYIYKDDVVYEFYSDGVLQNEDMLAIVQTAVDNAGDTSTFLEQTFQPDVCTFTTYSNIDDSSSDKE